MLKPETPPRQTDSTSELEAELAEARALIKKQQKQLAKQAKQAEKHEKLIKSKNKVVKSQQRKLDKAKAVIAFQKKAHDYLENASRHLLAGENSSSNP